ncbi:cytochrome c biogenesis protein CcsA [Aeromicrobium phragmitis]|nr:cytochrome c biogenesis protein CcsA [Aeromicrobium phragmitis]
MTRRLLAPVGLRWMTGTVAVVACALVLGTVVAPPDAIQGHAQRLMYVHVPVAWSAYLCFTVVLIASLAFLRRRGPLSAAVGQAAGEVGVVLTALTLFSGSLWGALTWGTWWVWDARVTATVAMGLVYLIYLSARGIATGARGQMLTALIGVVGFAIVPVVHFSVVWWRTLHQPATILSPDLTLPIEGRMALALAVSFLAMTLVTLTLLRLRVHALLPAARGQLDASTTAVHTTPGAGAGS